eukprot:gb/GEZN01022765.1/.p2 GENE.gb/GEZN01022765.1/~~gb/GEZN01022765.1/.p2  ORF type:complete len:108 (-),score=15.36 gb/GEZN01022765.1/:176-499(-)
MHLVDTCTNIVAGMPWSNKNPLTAEIKKTAILKIDNAATLLATEIGVHRKNQRHLDIRYAHIASEVAKTRFETQGVGSTINAADILTKPPTTVADFNFKLNIINPSL